VSRAGGAQALARWLAPPLALLLAGCTAAEPEPVTTTDDTASPFADCAALSASPAGGGAAAPDLPDVSLPCFTGGGQVRLAGLRGPAVINLWGSWCGPCREELPIIQELADATAGRLRVIGVDTADSRDAGASFAADQGVTLPTLYDRDKKLLSALGRATLPVTVFVGADGRRQVYTGKALDKPTLGGLVRAHTGVTVTG
jgi:cytochrome c biogenesis protein CcmG/thiol:disulfide interchange protein DsbE